MAGEVVAGESPEEVLRMTSRYGVELQMNHWFSQSRTFSWLKAATSTSASTFRTLC